MKNVLSLILVAATFGVGCSRHKQVDLTKYVDPFIGTAYVGHTHPAAQVPFGMVQVGPDTGTDLWEHCSGYYSEDTSIIGFSHTHLSGTGCPDMGDVLDVDSNTSGNGWTRDPAYQVYNRRGRVCQPLSLRETAL